MPPIQNQAPKKTSSATSKKAPALKKQAPPAKVNAVKPKNDGISISKEADQSRGTPGNDKLSPRGTMPNLIESFGGDDQVWMNGDGESEVRTGAGDDIVGLGDWPGNYGDHDTKIDGGEGRDTVFAGGSTINRDFTVTDENGKTVAKNGEGGDKIQVKNVESVHARTRSHGTEGNDKIVSDLQTGESDVAVHEEHTVFAGKGDDQVSVRTGDNGSSRASIWGGEGDNQIQFKGGEGSDQVSYISERDKDNPNAEGSDQVRLDGGGGRNSASISSRNYRVIGEDGKVVSQMGEGRDQISLSNFQRLTIHNGRGEKGFESFDF